MTRRQILVSTSYWFYLLVETLSYFHSMFSITPVINIGRSCLQWNHVPLLEQLEHYEAGIPNKSIKIFSTMVILCRHCHRCSNLSKAWRMLYLFRKPYKSLFTNVAIYFDAFSYIMFSKSLDNRWTILSSAVSSF